jgi:hypothetical protein
MIINIPVIFLCQSGSDISKFMSIIALDIVKFIEFQLESSISNIDHDGSNVTIYTPLI